MITMQDHIVLAKPPWHTQPEWSKFLKLSVPTYIENWPSELCRLSIAQVDIPLTIEEATALGTNIIELGEGFGTPADISDIERRLDDAVATFPAGAFVRLGSRSPKDAFYADLSKPVKTGKEALAWLLGGSERIADDLHLDLEPWQEFRCFMNGCRLAGISQYYYREHEPKVALYKDSIKWAIEEHFFPEFRDATPLQSVVFDVFVRVRELEGERETQVKLLEINPFFEMTDPCLFDWRKPEMFDGRMLTVPQK